MPNRSEPILKIKAKRYTAESAVVSIRIPKDMLSELDETATQTGRTRNEIITTCLEFALRHMTITNEEDETL